jgi:hypothetical protein
MSKIDRAEDCAMTNPKHVLSLGLAAATFLAVLPFFAGGVVLYLPSVAPLLVQTGLVPGTGPAWFAPVFATIALALGASAFALSWNQRSFLVAGLLAISGVMWMMPGLIATGYLSTIVVPGPILGFISGMVIFGLGVAKGLGTAKTAIVVAAR